MIKNVGNTSGEPIKIQGWGKEIAFPYFLSPSCFSSFPSSEMLHPHTLYFHPSSAFPGSPSPFLFCLVLFLPLVHSFSSPCPIFIFSSPSSAFFLVFLLPPSLLSLSIFYFFSLFLSNPSFPHTESIWGLEWSPRFHNLVLQDFSGILFLKK